MEKKFEQNTNDMEMGEEQLSFLIKEAGEEARRKKRDTMARHLEALNHPAGQGFPDGTVREPQ